MPVATTYPGVYVEELPSGVHTITGVSTSITAFIGYTRQGPVDLPVHIFGFADFERAFGGLATDSPLSYCVKHFFQNGGNEAYVVRVAQGATAASVRVENAAAAAVLEIAAASAGTWGNNLQVDVDYDTSDPANTFNLTATEYVERNGQMVVGRHEVFRNLSLSEFDRNYAVDTVNAKSELVAITRLTGVTGNGKSIGGVLTVPDVTVIPAGYRLAYTLNGDGPYEIVIAAPTAPAGPALAQRLKAINDDIVAAINAKSPPGVTAIVPVDHFEFTAATDAAHPAARSSIRFLSASANSLTSQLKLGQANGGSEIDAASALRPVPTGTTGTVGAGAFAATGALTLDIMKGASATPLAAGVAVPLWGAPTPQPIPASIDDVVADINLAFAALVPTQPLLAGATARRLGNTIRVLPQSADPNVWFKFSGATATALGLAAAVAPNVVHYALGVGVTIQSQVAGAIGNNGQPPAATDLIGSEAAKTGLYALEDVDLFNLLVMPDATANGGMPNVLIEAITYCTKRRAFMIIDAPESIATFAQAQTWMNSGASPLRSRNAALYFPRLREPDPLANGIVKTFAAAGALAGLYARTDAERGVWKAPAGTSAILVGATGLSYTMTDKENGTLNQGALNALRTFPVTGNVSWGARTGMGADSLADEYKYIPVRRLALFLEESLYRGTQWVVFEPNDEPLWAQIRLNLGAFMHTLFSQGAFQGRTPREAYFVKCDKETTTPNDQDLGRVNIVVGFAPLKPAEFVIIQIQQILPALQT